MASSRVIDRDLGWAKLRRELAKAEKSAVHVGIQGEAGAAERTEGMSNADLLAVHEFGSADGRIPERSVIRATVDEGEREYRSLLSRLGAAIVDAKIDVVRALGIAGEKVLGDMRRKVRAGIPPPNAPITVKRKGSSKPLIASGQLVQGLTYEVK